MAAAVTRMILIDCGAAETRAAFVENGVATHFWFGPARGDESLPAAPAAGDIYAGRVASLAKSLNAAFVDIGAGRAAFLPLGKQEKSPVEGARAVFIVRRPPIGDKGAVISADWRDGLSPAAVANIENRARDGFIGALGESADAAIAALNLRGPDFRSDDVAVIVNDPYAKRLIEDYGVPSVALSERPFAEFEVEAIIEESLAPEISLTGGARLIIQETAAGAMIDVDTATASGGARLNDNTNIAGLDHLLVELSRRRLGGRIIVDFLPPSGAPARGALAKRLEAGLKSFSKARVGDLRKDGLADFTLPRRQRSLLDEASEPAGEGMLRRGRRLTLDWSAKAAIRSLEDALRAGASLKPRLLAGNEIAAYLRDERAQWPARLAAKFGARFEIAEGEGMGARAYEIA